MLPKTLSIILLGVSMLSLLFLGTYISLKKIEKEDINLDEDKIIYNTNLYYDLDNPSIIYSKDDGSDIIKREYNIEVYADK